MLDIVDLHIVLLVSGVQLSNSGIHIHIPIVQIPFLFPLLLCLQAPRPPARPISCPGPASGAEPPRGQSRDSHGGGGAGRATKGQEPGVLPALPSHWPNYFLNFILPGREVVGANSHKQGLYLKLKKKNVWKFPGSSVVGIPCFHCQGSQFDPSWETKIPHLAMHCCQIIIIFKFCQ